MNSDISAGRHVLRQEAAALQSMAAALDGAFSEAVDIVFRTKGRVIVSGIGKSGHIAGKLAATLSSTGTPAFCVHPTEASHGDLGMITRDDCVVLLSNSGETKELSDLTAYTRRFDIPLIAIVGSADSTLAQHSDVAIILPDIEEACPMGLAPTTSTTVSLAIGDALAVTLLNKKGFTVDQFRVFHPGGKLGQSLVRVCDVMRTGEEIPLIAIGQSVSAAIEEMTRKTFGCVGVVDADGKLIGIITDGDLRRHIGGNIANQLVQQIMTTSPKSIGEDALAAEALSNMNAAKVSSLFVIEDKSAKPVGIVRIHDCLQAGIY